MVIPEVIIVGGGIAGLCCARKLHQAGVSFRILEASDNVGGRVRTDCIDGFRCDRGFQVFPTAYPEAKQVVDYEALRLGKFSPGALVRYKGKFCRFADPRRHPQHIFTTLFSPLGTLGDKFRLGRMQQSVCRGPLDELYQRPEMTTMEKLRGEGFSERIIEHFFKPFFGGVFLDSQLTTSSRMFDFVFRMFTSGHAALPAGGMEAIPAQLAAELPEEAIWTDVAVEKVERNLVRLKSGQSLTAAEVVVACEAPVAVKLLGAASTNTEARPATCIYFSADKPPFKEPIIVLNGEGHGPVNSLCVPSQVAEGYAPHGQSLISVSVLGSTADSDTTLRDTVLEQLRGWYGTQVDHWRHLTTHRIAYALPNQVPPSLSPVAKPVRRHDGIFVCGDYLDTASIQGAMVSGRRAAESVLASRNQAMPSEVSGVPSMSTA
jgi:phytoene dehydrogenase-like protein